MQASASESSAGLGPLEQALCPAGLDLVVPRGLAEICAECQSLGLKLPARNNPLGVLLGNTRALWPRFLAAVRAEPGLRKLEHPLDTWVESGILGALGAVGLDATTYFAHRQLTMGYLPLQHWAQELGVLTMSPSHLSVHPEYGPWIALRALVVIDLEATEENAVRPATEPCASCSGPCRRPFEQAAQASEQHTGSRRVTEHWREWLAVRDACPLGTQHRYTEEQIRYHYAHDRLMLDA